MTDRSPWLIALATANFLVLVALAVFVRARIVAVEDRLDARDAREARGGTRDSERVRSPGRGREPTSDEAPKPGTIEYVSAQLDKLAADAYDRTQDEWNDHHDFRRTLKQIDSAVKKIHHALAAPGTPAGEWALDKKATAGTTLSKETLDSYRRDATNWGVAVEPGRVVVRGFLNPSPWTTMPIEYFITRYPESGHETLLHLIGPKGLEDVNSADALKGLTTALYKGLVAAGFVEADKAESGHFDAPLPGDKDGKDRWVPPKGDDVYVGVRYMLGGKLNVARATDWVIDPATMSVLPEQAFKFIGSLRQDDFQSGDEQVSAEAGGVIVSVYSNPNALVEIALADNRENRYLYNHTRIPKPTVLRLGKSGPLLEGVRDRARSTLTLKTIERDGMPSPIEKAPLLVGRTPNGDPVEVLFKKNDDGTFTVESDVLAKSEWKVRMELDGRMEETSGFEPLYVDIVLSKTPIVPEGDGAKPLEKIDVPANAPQGTGPRNG